MSRREHRRRLRRGGHGRLARGGRPGGGRRRLVSFLSPCVLPLVPGYLSFVTGLSGEELGARRQRRSPPPAPRATTPARTPPRLRRSRVLAGSLLFVLGFSAVFVTSGALFGSLGSTLAGHQEVVDVVLGVLTVVLGLAFLGVVPGLQREVRFRAACPARASPVHRCSACCSASAGPRASARPSPPCRPWPIARRAPDAARC